MTNAIIFGADQENSWINLDSDQIRRGDFLQQTYGITEEAYSYALDRNERAHMEYDELSQTFILIFNMPQCQKSNPHFETIPITFLIQENRIITITNSQNHYILDTMKSALERNPNASIFKFLFINLVSITDLFFPLVEEIDFERKLVNDKLKKKTSKNNLFKLSDLEIGTVYLISASRQNDVLLEQAKKHQIFGILTDVEKEQLDDALIEAQQLVEMVKLSSQVLQQLSSTYNTVLNNTLNDTMKLLTVLSVLLTIPTIVTGFFGMNMPLPFEHNVYGWGIAILVSIFGWFALSYILRRILK